MKLINIILLSLLIPVLCLSKTLWNEDGGIYSTKQKYKKGDTLKIIFNEKSIVNYQVSMSEDDKKTSTARGVQGQIINFLPPLSGGDNFQTSQKSSTKNNSALQKEITAQITGILDNENLQISGSHTIQVNDTYEQVNIKGIVNPHSIKNKKFVYSTDVIDPSISYKSQIIKPDTIGPKDYIKTFTTNIVSMAKTNISPQGKTNISAKQQTNISSQYQVSDQKKNELILKYLNRVLSVLFAK